MRELAAELTPSRAEVFLVFWHTHIRVTWFVLGRFQTWAKHWFVLRGTCLTLYRDTGAEDLNVTDGVIDLSRAQRVEERDTEKNYGFQITVRPQTGPRLMYFEQPGNRFR